MKEFYENENLAHVLQLRTSYGSGYVMQDSYLVKKANTEPHSLFKHAWGPNLCNNQTVFAFGIIKCLGVINHIRCIFQADLQGNF